MLKLYYVLYLYIQLATSDGYYTIRLRLIAISLIMMLVIGMCFFLHLFVMLMDDCPDDNPMTGYSVGCLNILNHLLRQFVVASLSLNMNYI